MAPQILFDFTVFDFDRPQYDVDAIATILPHRGHMAQLDAIVHINESLTEAVAYKDVRDDEFWVEGHIPGRPLFPGVLMIEAAAQLSSFVTCKRLNMESFIGFVGADDVKFRGQVVPGDRLTLLTQEVKFSPRRFVCSAQGLVNGSIVFEGKLKGMAI